MTEPTKPRTMTFARWFDFANGNPTVAATADVVLVDRKPDQSPLGFAWHECMARTETGEFRGDDKASNLPTWIFRRLGGYRKVNYSKSRIYKTAEAAQAALNDACRRYAQGKIKREAVK